MTGCARRVPWGPEDRRGALNYITPAEVRAAAAEVRLGRTVGLEAPVISKVTPDNPDPALHQMTGTAQDAAPTGLSFATDRLVMNIHGNADSHLDALCHVIYDRHLYNGVPADTVTMDGADRAVDRGGQGRHHRTRRAAGHPAAARGALAGTGRPRDRRRPGRGRAGPAGPGAPG